MATTKKIACWTVGLTALVALTLVLGSVGPADAQVAPPIVDRSADRTDAADEEHFSSDSLEAPKEGCKASDIIGMDVRAKAGDDNIGSINDLMISKEGKVKYVAVSFGGFLGMGDKLFAVPFEAVQFTRTGTPNERKSYARIDVTEQTLKNREGFDQDNWPEEADQSFLGATREVGRVPSTQAQPR